MTLAERIASEIMDTIERERRINKDDLIAAAERALQRWEKEQHPAYLVRPGEIQAWAEANEALIHPPAFISAAPVQLERSEDAIVEILPSYFRPKPAPTRFGTET